MTVTCLSQRDYLCRPLVGFLHSLSLDQRSSKLKTAPLTAAGPEDEAMVVLTSQTSSLHLLTPGASVSWLSSTTRTAGGPLGPGPWALWKGTWTGCCSWSGARFKQSRRRLEGSLQCQMLHPAATGHPLLLRHASALQSASSSVSVPSPSPSSPLWPATLPFSPAVPAPSAGSATPLLACHAAAPPTATPVSPDLVQCWSTGGQPHFLKGATVRAGCTPQTGALHPRLRGSAAL